MKRTLTLFVAMFASLAISMASPASAQWALHEIVANPYGKVSALPSSKKARGQAATAQNRGRQAYVFYTQKCVARDGYDECMRRWKVYCDNVGRQGKMPGRVISMAASIVPVVGGIVSELGSWAQDEASYAENSCHYAQRAYSDKYEYERTRRDNEEFLRQQREDLEDFAIQIEEKQKRLAELTAKAAALETAAQLTETIQKLKASEGGKPPPAASAPGAPVIPQPPAPAKPQPATPEGKEVPSVQAPAKPVPKAEVPKPKEAVPVRPSKDGPKGTPLPRFAPPPDMAKAMLKHPDIAFNPARNK